MKRSPVYLAFILVLVIIIAVLGVLIVQQKAPEQNPEPSSLPTVAPPVESAAPTASEPTEAPVEETAEPTEAPVFETRPPETPTPTAEPTPIPAAASGSFASDTGTGLNLRVDWRLYTDASGAQKLNVTVSTMSYSFYTSALYQAITLTVAGESYSANSKEVSYDGSALISTPMAEFTLDAPASGSSISVVWNYRGSYSGKDLENISASGVIVY